MSTVFRRLTQQTLEGMEAGKFQDFCLDSLPLWSSRFEGLVRFGHTASGKTRAGTPDLLKTMSDGQQVGVQCGTDEYYWRSESIEASKPYTDAKAWVQKLERPAGIALISNREIPTNAPNIKSDLIAALRGDTTATITPVSVEEISDFVAGSLHDPRVLLLVRQYFPDVSLAVGADEERRRYSGVVRR